MNMKVLFLTLLDFSSFGERNIYTDLLREFMRDGHEVYCISASERNTGVRTHFEENGHLLKLRIGNTQKTNIIEKGLSTLMMGPQLVRAIKKYFSDISFDLILYPTPPVTIADAVKYVKKRDGAKTYLMLKDIFPQNAIDIGLMSKGGITGFLYRYFVSKEKKLYEVSDFIGCMSEANRDYIIRNYPYVDKSIVGVCPNCVEITDMSLEETERAEMRKKYGIPQDKRVFVYGGNLGKPQGIPFFIECLRTQFENKDAYFLIVGDGTEYQRLERFFSEEKPENMKLMKHLPKADYDRLVAACDVGMIFLDHRFTIPNFPSRLLSYMQAGLPVLAVTDPNTDVGKALVEGGFGWWCESNDTAQFSEIVKKAMIKDKGTKERAFSYLEKHYDVKCAYKTIMDSVSGSGE